MNILLIDLSSIAHPIWHVTDSQRDTNPNACSEQTVARVRALATDQPHAVICCDSGRSFRRDVSPDYKANRPESDAALQHQIMLAMETLRGDWFPVWAVKGFEADDLIATAATRALFGIGVEQTQFVTIVDGITIASADKDLLQLVNERVTVKSLKDGSIIDAGAVEAKFGVRPDQIRDYLSLVGDTSDNVIGAKGIGAVGAKKLLTTFGTLEDLYAAMDNGEAALTPAVVASLTEFRGRWPVVRELITLRTDVPLPFEEVFRPRVPVDVAVFGEDTDGDENMGARGDGGEGNAVVGSEADNRDLIFAADSSGVDGGARRVDERGGADSSRAGVGGDAVTGSSAASGGNIDTNSSADRVRPAVTPATALAVREPDVLPAPVEWGKELEPRNLREAEALGQRVFKSRNFSAYGTPEGVLCTVLAGRELGMQAMASLRAFHIIEGKPTLSAGAIHSVVLKSGAAKYFRCTERTAERATFVTKRGDDPEMSLTFTIAEARQAWSKDEKAWNASGWGKNPADMLVARALTKLARLVYPDVCHGLYAPEEME